MPEPQFWNQIYRNSEEEDRPEATVTVLDRALSFFGDLSAKSVLDLGCGRGASSVYLAARAAKVTAVDISEYAISDLRKLCKNKGISNVFPVHSTAMEVAKLGTFDAIFGSMILHHIEPFPEFTALLNQSMAPFGKAFFYENNASSRLLIWFRQNVVGKLWVPKFGDPDEFPVTPDEIDELRKHFTVDQEFPEMLFFRLASTYLFRGAISVPFQALDDFLYKNRLFLKHSYRQYVLIEKGA